MPLSPKAKTALIVVLALAVLAGIGGSYLFYRQSRPLTGPVSGSAPDVFSLLPPDAPVIAYLDAKALRTTQSASLAAIGQLVLPASQQDPDYTEFVRNTGFDYSRDLDHAALALWPTELTAAASAAGDNRTLAIADGRFDQQRIKSYALRTGYTVSLGAQTIYEVPGNPSVAFEFLSATRVMMASGKDPTQLLTKPSAAPRNSEAQGRINRVAGAPLFAVAATDHLPGSFYAAFQNSAQLQSLIRSIQAVTLAGQPQGNNLDLTLDAECSSMKNALEIGTLLDGFRMLGSVALNDPKERGQMTKQQAVFLAALLGHMKVNPQDNWVRIAIDLTPAMLAGKSPQH